MPSNAALKIEYIKALEAKLAHNKRNKLRLIYDSFHPFQKKFTAATKDHSNCLLMAANQVGKTRTGCCIDAYHLTGDYPDDWHGYRFEFAPVVWLLGYSGEKTRDLLQQKLFGKYHNKEFEGGYIPRDKIIDWVAMGGVPRAMREVRVKHKHGVAVCQFWSYSQGQHALMGDVVDFAHIDEEPEDAEIYPQVLTRLINGDRGRGGRLILTFTPENGKTELVSQFMDTETPGQHMITATWDDALHLSEEKKALILNQYPLYQRDMRSRGIPLMGAGLIYEIDESLVRCEPFDIPLHFRVINGMDFGWDHPQAHVQLAIDDDNQVIYVCHGFKRSKIQAYEAWQATKSWSEAVPVAWPQDGLQTREDGKKAQEKKQMFIDAGFNMLDEHATFEGGGTSVWTGIVQLNQLFKTGQLRIFSTCHEVFEEIRQYHTKLENNGNGDAKIVKIKDDLLDAIRYAYMMRRHAVRYIDLWETDEHYDITPDSDNAMGY